jgi:hypothetical protein
MITIDQIIEYMAIFDYNDLFLNKLFPKKNWTIEELVDLKIPFFLHTGEYEQFYNAIQYWNDNFTQEERNARIHDYLARHNQRFAERLTLKTDIFTLETFQAFYNKHVNSPWARREELHVKELKELYPAYKLGNDFADPIISGSAKVPTYNDTK